MKEIVWDNDDKMHIETGNKGFDKACKCLFKGNAITDTQSSNYVRPKSEVECNGMVFAEGDLRKFDLHHGICNGMPQRYKDSILKSTETEPAILYKIFHYRGKTQIVHGWILTKTNNDLIGYYCTDHRIKTSMVMDEVVQYLSNPASEKILDKVI